MCICVCGGTHTGEGVLYGILGGYKYCQKKQQPHNMLFHNVEVHVKTTAKIGIVKPFIQ